MSGNARKVGLRDRPMPSYTRGEEIFNMVSHMWVARWGLPQLRSV